MKKDIVIIDDCELINLSFMKLLPDSSSPVRSYASLQDALKNLQGAAKRRPCIFILDLEVVTPEGVRKLMSTAAPDTYDVILMTSLPLSHVEKEIGTMKVAKIFTKPFNIRELTDLVITLNREW